MSDEVEKFFNYLIQQLRAPNNNATGYPVINDSDAYSIAFAINNLIDAKLANFTKEQNYER